MSADPSLLAVFAHPDDETLAAGGLLARAAASGVATHLVVATAGERGWKGSPRPRPEEIARWRDAELHAAAGILGVRTVRILGVPDGAVEGAPPEPIVRRLATRIRELRPWAVLTFGPDGITGHPDHVAVSRLATTAAWAAAADVGLPLRPHHVGALWQVGMTRPQHEAYEALIGPLAWAGATPPRRPPPREPWTFDAEVDARPFVDSVREAVLCHGSQLRDPAALRAAPAAAWAAAFGRTSLSRGLSRGARPDPVADLLAPALDPAPAATSA